MSATQACFFVQNNWTKRGATPVRAFARNRGLAFEDRTVDAQFDPLNCGVDWGRYHPILPYGSLEFVRKLKHTPLKDYVLLNEEKFTARAWSAALGERMIDAELLVDPNLLAYEWRCWIIGNRLVDVSQYRKDGQEALLRGAPPPLVEFVYRILNTWIPEPCVTMDVAMTPAGLRVIRFNSIHASGWQAANSTSVLLAWLKWAKRHLC